MGDGESDGEEGVGRQWWCLGVEEAPFGVGGGIGVLVCISVA
jgi:hypothetical protein